jgi:hypothetical protein
MGCYPSSHVDQASPLRQARLSQSCPATYYNKSKPFERVGLTWSSDTPITLSELEQKRLLFWETAHVYGVHYHLLIYYLFFYYCLIIW